MEVWTTTFPFSKGFWIHCIAVSESSPCFLVYKDLNHIKYAVLYALHPFQTSQAQPAQPLKCDTPVLPPKQKGDALERLKENQHTKSWREKKSGVLKHSSYYRCLSHSRCKPNIAQINICHGLFCFSNNVIGLKNIWIYKSVTLFFSNKMHQLPHNCALLGSFQTIQPSCGSERPESWTDCFWRWIQFSPIWISECPRTH